MQFQAVIFDLDGTLIDSERHNMRAWIDAGRQLGYALSEEFYYTLVGRRPSDSDAALQAHFGVECQVATWRSLRRRVFYEAWDAGAGPGWKPGLQSVLDVLQLPRAIATSSSALEAHEKLRRTELAPHFSICVTGDEVQAGKPAPDLFLEAARRVGVEPQHCLAVEDSPLGVEAALQAGMAVAFIPDLIDASPQLRRDACAVLEDLSGILPLLVARRG